MVDNKDKMEEFVVLSDIVKDVILEMRYYFTYNFIGDRIDGYEEPCALLTRKAAYALKEVSNELIKKGYRLKIYDAYRPQRAVRHFLEWSKDEKDLRMKKYFYPNLDKHQIIERGFVLEKSAHSRGSTVDVTLFDMDTAKDVDMGSTFDFFGKISHSSYKDITDEQFKNRMILRKVMLSHGFTPYREEWWHFTLKDEPFSDTYFDFPVNSNYLK